MTHAASLVRPREFEGRAILLGHVARWYEVGYNVSVLDAEVVVRYIDDGFSSQVKHFDPHEGFST